MGKHADLSFLWIDYKKEHPNGYQLAQFYKLYRDFMAVSYTHLDVYKRQVVDTAKIFLSLCI